VTVPADIAAGAALGLQFHLVFAAVTAAGAAAIAGYRRAPRSRSWLAAGVVLTGWAAGDGVRIAGSSAGIAVLVPWALAALAIGYALPAAAGAYVGRQVHRGTGYLSAAVVALMFVSTLSAVAGPIADALMRSVS
jgi:hypothetical protein